MFTEFKTISTENAAVIRFLKFDTANLSKADLSILTDREKLRFKEFKLPKRQAEFYFVRLLWKTFGVNEDINYDEDNRPILNNGYISISHSGNVVAIAYHPTHQIGVDVEFHSPKLRKTANKFVSVEDLPNAKNDKDLTLIWSCKEAVYKMEKKLGLSFKDHIHVLVKPNKANVDVIKEQERHHYEFEYKDYGDFILCYCSHANLNGVSIF